MYTYLASRTGSLVEAGHLAAHVIIGFNGHMRMQRRVGRELVILSQRPGACAADERLKVR